MIYCKCYPVSFSQHPWLLSVHQSGTLSFIAHSSIIVYIPLTGCFQRLKRPPNQVRFITTTPVPDICYVHYLLFWLLRRNTWQRQLNEEQFCFSSQFLGYRSSGQGRYSSRREMQYSTTWQERAVVTVDYAPPTSSPFPFLSSSSSPPYPSPFSPTPSSFNWNARTWNSTAYI